MFQVKVRLLLLLPALALLRGHLPLAPVSEGPRQPILRSYNNSNNRSMECICTTLTAKVLACMVSAWATVSLVSLEERFLA